MILAGIPGLGSLVSQAAGLGASAVLSAMAASVADSARWLMDQIGSVLSVTTEPLVGAAWFAGRYAVMTQIGAAVLLVFLAACAIQAVVRHDPGLLVRAAVVQLPLAVLLTLSAVELVQLGVSLVDRLSDLVAGGSGAHVAGFLTVMGTDLGSLATNAPVFMGFFVALVVVVGGFLVWLELIVRSVAIDAATLFLPLALATMVWPAAASIARRLVDVLVALIISKFVIVAVLALGAAALGSGTGFSAVVTGTAMLLLATLTPMALLRLIPLAEFSAVSHLAGTGRRSVAAAASTTWSLAGVVAGAGGGAGLTEVVATDPVRFLTAPTLSGPLAGLDHPPDGGDGPGPPAGGDGGSI
ncbi:MAG: hypothetical protein ACYCTI_08980 [Acidimicrobiales bacterium]